MNLPIIAIIVNLISTIVGILHKPITALTGIPKNWHRIILCTDAAHPRELVLGIERLTPRRLGLAGSELFYIVDSKNEIYSSNPVIANTGKLINPAFLLWSMSRASLKSTALIWSPLLWIVFAAQGSGSARVDLTYIRDLPMYKAMRIYSLFILGLFAAKLWLVFKLADWLPSQGFFHRFIAPEVLITSWQAAGLLNAVSSWALLLFAQWQLMGIQHNSPSTLSDGTVRWILGPTSVVRNLLTCWIIICTIWIIWQLQWPEFKFQYLPR